jgi:serine/threonine protein kinase
MIGSTLSHYVVEALLGQGGMGAVYRARDTVLNRTVAIKVLTAAGDRESTRRLLHEARAASALNHPNIVTIHAVGRERDVDFIVMEYVAGEPLTIPAGGFPIDRAIDCASQVAAALAATHDAGIVHRDVKPANVMIAGSGQINVLDFGIARRTVFPPDSATVPPTVETTAFGAGTMTGTPGYMSPEQIAGGAVNARSDVFSLGVLMFEMLTGRTAFAGGSRDVEAGRRRPVPGLPPSIRLRSGSCGRLEGRGGRRREQTLAPRTRLVSRGIRERARAGVALHPPQRDAALSGHHLLPRVRRHAVLEGGHLPPRPQEVFKEVLDWLDRYLGPVRK